MKCLTLSEVPGSCEWLIGVKKCVGVVPVHFQLELNTLGLLGTPAQKKKI